MKVPSKLLSFFKREKRFCIATHINPEGDALGSSLALSMALASQGKKTFLYNKDAVPDFYNYLPGHKIFKQSIPSSIQDSWPLVLLDCNTKERAGIDRLNFKYSVVIDHHETESTFGDIRWIEPGAAATGIMIFHILKDLKITITKDIAVNLYSAIAIDTGTFRYSNTTADILRVSSGLIEAGANPAYISNYLYEMWSRNRFKLLIMVLNTFEINNNIAMMFVTKDMFRKTRTAPNDTETFSEFPRRIKDIEISAFFREISKDYWNVSLRSRGDINVAKIALNFQGGGHKNAAGYRIKATLKTAKKALIQEVKSAPKRLTMIK